MNFLNVEEMVVKNCTFHEFDSRIQERVDELIAAAVLAERERVIALFQAEIDHAAINDMRLQPLFGRITGEMGVRASALEAAIEGARTQPAPTGAQKEDRHAG